MTGKDLKNAVEKLGISLDGLQAETVKKYKAGKLKLAVAESCTGGLISKKITEVPGASEIFDCGVCSYANKIKHRILGVKEKTLELNGAVSYQTAIQMAQGIRRLARADVGISVTGIAGPDGGTAEKPVGLVFIGVSNYKGTFAVRCLFNHDKTLSRGQIRELAAQTALYLALSYI